MAEELFAGDVGNTGDTGDVRTAPTGMAWISRMVWLFRAADRHDPYQPAKPCSAFRPASRAVQRPTAWRTAPPASSFKGAYPHPGGRRRPGAMRRQRAREKYTRPGPEPYDMADALRDKDTTPQGVDRRLAAWYGPVWRRNRPEPYHRTRR